MCIYIYIYICAYVFIYIYSIDMSRMHYPKCSTKHLSNAAHGHPSSRAATRLTAVSREGLEEKYQTLDLDSPAWEEQALQYLARKDCGELHQRESPKGPKRQLQR